MPNSLRYQPVINSDGTVSIHEALVDSQGNIKSTTYEPVKLIAASFGELSALVRHIYRNLQKVKPITEEELEVLMCGAIAVQEELNFDDDNIINLIDYLA